MATSHIVKSREVQFFALRELKERLILMRTLPLPVNKVALFLSGMVIQVFIVEDRGLAIVLIVGKFGEITVSISR